jgi:hypothetical protein
VLCKLCGVRRILYWRVARAKRHLIRSYGMSIEVIYQGLSIAKDARFRLQDGGVFVQLEGPMPVATQLALRSGDNTLRGRVRRVVEKAEGQGSGMLVGPAEGTRLPRWLKQLEPEIQGDVEFEPEPPPVVEAKPEPAPDSKPDSKPEAAEAKADAKPEASGEVKTEAAAKADAESQKSPAPAEGEHASDEEEEESKPAAKSDGKKAPAKAKKKGGSRRR